MIANKWAMMSSIAAKVQETNPDDYDRDNYGQVVIYTSFYRWKNGEFHDEPDPLIVAEENSNSGE